MITAPTSTLNLPITDLKVIATLAPKFASFQLCWVNKNGDDGSFIVSANMVPTFNDLLTQAIAYLKDFQKFISAQALKISTDDPVGFNITQTVTTNGDAAYLYMEAVINAQGTPPTPEIIYQIKPGNEPNALLYDLNEQITSVISALEQPVT